MSGKFWAEMLVRPERPKEEFVLKMSQTFLDGIVLTIWAKNLLIPTSKFLSKIISKNISKISVLISTLYFADFL